MRLLAAVVADSLKKVSIGCVFEIAVVDKSKVASRNSAESNGQLREVGGKINQTMALLETVGGLHVCSRGMHASHKATKMPVKLMSYRATPYVLYKEMHVVAKRSYPTTQAIFWGCRVDLLPL